MIRALFLILIGAVVLAVAVLLVGGQRHGPEFTGGGFSVWIKRAGPEARVDEAVAAEGSKLVEELMSLLDWQPSRTERVSRKIYDSLPASWQSSFRLLEIADPDLIRRQALRSLGGLGPDAALALPTILVWGGGSDETAGEAMTAALRIAPASTEANAAVLAALLDENARRRDQAARALVRSDVPVTGGLPALQDGLNRPEPVTPAGVEAFGVYGTEASRAVPRLAPLLAKPELTSAVLTAFRRIGPASSVALGDLQPLLNPGSSSIVDALDLLAVIGPGARSALPVIKPLEENPAPMIRLLAAAARGRMGVDEASAVKALAQEIQFQIPDHSLGYYPNYPGLRDLRLTPAQAAAWWLGKLGRAARPATPELTAAVQGEDPRLMVLSAWALWRINQEAEFVVPAIRAGLRFTPDPDTQLLAATAAGELGPLGTLLEPELTEVQTLNLALRRAGKSAQERIATGVIDPVR